MTDIKTSEPASSFDSEEINIVDSHDSPNSESDTDDCFMSNVSHIPVMEKLVFCIDTCNNEDTSLESIRNLVEVYMNLRKTVSVGNKSVEYQFMFLQGEKFYTPKVYLPKNFQKKDLMSVFSNIKKIEPFEEKQPYDLNLLFKHIIDIIELPDSNVYTNNIPPPYVYHVIFLFNHNKYIPEMKETNAFDFLISSPYFSLDVIYIYDTNIKNNKCEKISQVLTGLKDGERGYFFVVNKHEIKKQFVCVAQCLGHPSIRFPQNKCEFNMQKLWPDCLLDEKIEQ